MSTDELFDQLREVAVEAEQRSAAVGVVYRPLMNDRLRGRSDLSRAEIRARAEAAADVTHPQSPTTLERRERTLREAGDLYLSGSDADRRRLEEVMGGHRGSCRSRGCTSSTSPTGRSTRAPSSGRSRCAPPSPRVRTPGDLLSRLHAIVYAAHWRGLRVGAEVARVSSRWPLRPA